jgi:hypothetical protein
MLCQKNVPVLILILTVLLLSLMLFLFRNTPSENTEPTDVVPERVTLEAEKLLPDLVVSPPRELYLEITSDIKNLRFSTTFINTGKGDLKILSDHDPESEVTTATQIITRKDGSEEEHRIGTFVFHPTHEHWHIEEYVIFQIWSLNENEEKGEMLVSTDKMSFCIWDEEEYKLTLENASETRKYIGCNNEVQGISVGWSDTYPADMDGQSIDISQIPDGRYLVSTVINPDRKIIESDYSNNESLVMVEILGSTISMVQK